MRSIAYYVIVALFLVMAAQNAEASFVVDWGKSWDSPKDEGYKFLGRWLYNNGYFSDVTSAGNFAKDNYISATDPFYFAAGLYEFKIVYENSAYINKNKFGYYDNVSNAKYQIFAGTDDIATPSKILDIDEDFGLYLRSNYKSGTYWYTDRYDNIAQSGNRLAKNNPQGLIYQLNSCEWLIAWEDLDTTNWKTKTDNDYNDMYILVNRCTPEPASLSFLGLGLFGLLGFKRKK